MLKFIKKEDRVFGQKLERNKYHYIISNSRDESVGTIYYTKVGRFMHYCLFPDKCNGHDLFFTNGCLKEISKFITSLYRKDKKIKKKVFK